MIVAGDVTKGDQARALSMSTVGFTVCFAVWTIFSIIGVQIKEDLGLNDTQFGLLVATPVLTGSISRIFLGIWTEQFGGRRVFSILMAVTAIAVWLLSSATTYPMFLLAALGVGLAGGSFIVGIAYTSRWFEKEKQGTALGIFGVGNAGAAITNFGAPFLVVALGWEQTAQIYSVVLMIMAVLFWFLTKEDTALLERRKTGAKPKSVREQLEPLRHIQVWRFSLYYFFVFGAFVALASWLPRYYVGVYELDLKTAGMLAAAYSLPGGIFRALGGWMSDKWGARAVMYWTFYVCLGCCFVMAYPATSYIIEGIEGDIPFRMETPIWLFASLSCLLGFMMSLGKAAVYKHIPVYYPDNVGSVGGLVGMIGGLGGFVLPICFGILNDVTHVWTGCFMLLFGIILMSLIWMHFSIRALEKQQHPGLQGPQELGQPPK